MACTTCEGAGQVPISPDEVGQPVPCPMCCPDDYARGVQDERARVVAMLRAEAQRIEAVERYALGDLRGYAYEPGPEVRRLMKLTQRIEGGG